MPFESRRFSKDRDLGSLIATLADVTQFRHCYDYRLRQAIEHVLIEFNIEALVARVEPSGQVFAIVRPGTRDPGVAEDRLALIVNKWFDTSYAGKVNHIGVMDGTQFDDGLAWCIVALPGFVHRDEGGRVIDLKKQEYCIYLGRDIGTCDDKGLVADQRDVLALVTESVLVALRARDKIYSRFPRVLREAYWRESVQGGGRMCFRPPYDTGQPILTATLVLDLRKSTFGMERAVNKKMYADWVEEFVLILNQVSHDNQGVFDKFTGDGVIAHFLAIPKCDAALQGDSAKWPAVLGNLDAELAERAITCGFEMIDAVTYHLDKLRDIMTLNNSRFGPAVAVAIDEAVWSVDREGQPIVVGRGVVDACRAVSTCPPEQMQVTRLVQTLFSLSRGAIPGATEVPHESKEYSNDAGALLTRIPRTHFAGCRTRGQICELCEDVYDDVRGRTAERE